MYADHSGAARIGAHCEHTDLQSKMYLIVSPEPQTVSGGGRRDRTDDLMLAKHALSQLSYAPVPETNAQRSRRLADAMST